MKARDIILPDSWGHFGTHGGRFVPETLMTALDELETAYQASKEDAEFQLLIPGCFTLLVLAIAVGAAASVLYRRLPNRGPILQQPGWNHFDRVVVVWLLLGLIWFIPIFSVKNPRPLETGLLLLAAISISLQALAFLVLRARGRRQPAK